MSNVQCVRTIRIAERPNLIWVEIETDEGLVGLGESLPRRAGRGGGAARTGRALAGRPRLAAGSRPSRAT